MRNYPDGVELGRPLKTLDSPGFRLREALYDPGREIPPHQHPWATLCLVIEGGYHEDWGRTRVRCGPASLVFHPPGGRVRGPDFRGWKPLPDYRNLPGRVFGGGGCRDLARPPPRLAAGSA